MTKMCVEMVMKKIICSNNMEQLTEVSHLVTNEYGIFDELEDS